MGKLEIEIPEDDGHRVIKGKLNVAFVGETMEALEEKQQQQKSP